MAGTKIKAWVAGTVVVCLLVLVGAWFLAVSPKLVEAQDVRTSNEDALAQQTLLRQKLATLKEQFENLDQYRAELAGLRGQIPADAQLSAFVREVEAFGAAHGVTVVAMAPGVPAAPVAPPAVAPPVEQATEGEAAEGEATEASGEQAAEGVTAAPTEPPASPVPAGLVEISMSVSVVGPYANVTAFLTDLQTVGPRLMLVTSMSTTALDAAEASGGRPQTAPGDIEAIVDGRLYVLPPEAAAVAPPVDGEEAAEDPTLPTSSRNVFAPVTG